MDADPKVETAPTAVRIAHKWGHGRWHEMRDEEALRAKIVVPNTEYGSGSHWLETKVDTGEF